MRELMLELMQDPRAAVWTFWIGWVLGWLTGAATIVWWLAAEWYGDVVGELPAELGE